VLVSKATKSHGNSMGELSHFLPEEFINTNGEKKYLTSSKAFRVFTPSDP
jgi:hypothetical protein